MNKQSENDQCVISYRLLKLLQWLAEHEQEALKQLMIRSLKSGLFLDWHTAEKKRDILEAELKETVVGYFSLLEILLEEALEESDRFDTLKRKLIPALDRIDASFWDSATVASSVEKIISKSSGESAGEGTKQVVFKELLKRWKPEKKSFIN